MQCFNSERGLGYSYLQEGQPVAYGAQGLTPTEQNYAQIEKMLSVVVGCEKLDQYVTFWAKTSLICLRFWSFIGL